MGKLRAIAKFFGFLILVVLVIPTQGMVLLITKGPGSYYLPRLWHKTVSMIFGIRYEIVGTPNTNHQTLYMSNHLSYLDIPMIGGILEGSFVAKSEVESWPLFGFLSRLQQTAFIQRKRSEIVIQKNSLQARIAEGQSLIIFPEGTSTDGRSVLPFKSSLFSLALGEDNQDLFIQPLTIQLVTVNSEKPDAQDIRDLYAWHRDMDTDLASHLWSFAKTHGAHLRLTFHEPLKARDFDDRKTLAKICHDNVSKGLENKLAA